MFYRFRRKGVIYTTLLVLLFQATLAHAALVTFTNLNHASAPATVLTFTTLANNARGGAATNYDPVIAGLGYRLATVECVLTHGGTPTAGSSVDIWFLKRPDGTNFEDTATTRMPDVVCPVTGTGSTRVSFSDVRLPAVFFGATGLNNNTGQTVSGTVKILPYTQKGS